MAERRSLRFCLITTFYPPYSLGGDGVFVYRLAGALAARGHQVDVIYSEDAYRLQHPGEPEALSSEQENVTRHALRTNSPVASALSAYLLGTPAVYSARLRAILSSKAYDVIHYHNISLMGGPGVLREGRALKLYTTHEYWLVCPTHVLFKFDREACTERQCLQCVVRARRPPQLWRYTRHLQECTKHVDQFLVPSRFALEEHRRGGLSAPMTVLPNFVPTPPPPTTAEALCERPFFLFVGRLEKLKGVQDLIKIFHDYQDADLLVVGDGNYATVLRREAHGMPHVKFVGSVHPSEVGNYYRQTIAVLVPSLCYEVFPLVLAEALTHGAPVISRRIGALTEVVEQSGGGYTFETLDDCRALMGRLQRDPMLRDEIGTRGQRAAIENWTTDVHVDRYLRLISEIHDRKKATRAL